jgi:hypothetical protein
MEQGIVDCLLLPLAASGSLSKNLFSWQHVHAATWEQFTFESVAELENLLCVRKDVSLTVRQLCNRQIAAIAVRDLGSAFAPCGRIENAVASGGMKSALLRTGCSADTSCMKARPSSRAIFGALLELLLLVEVD